MIRSLRTSHSALGRAIRKPLAFQTRTLIIPTAVLRVDLVQEMYLKELKAYKPNPIKPSDADGHVLKFSVPKAPPSPEESDIINELKAYESQQVEVEGQASGGNVTTVDEDWFEDDEEEEAHGSH